jgi:gamma-glutamylcyclotransferase (GGCT)/AIG2-like uncharacterized protein YtfP
MSSYLFVYGTLLPDRAPPHLSDVVGSLRPVGPGSMTGRLYDLGDFPGAVYDITSAHRVVGRVFELSEDVALLQRLDTYEGYCQKSANTSLFVREQLPITLADGSQLLCWVFVYNRDPGRAPLVPGGDYIGSTTH